MRGTVAKRLRREAARQAIASGESSGLAARVVKRVRLGKTDSKGRELIEDRVTAKHAGFRRIYQDLKKAYRARRAA